MECKICGAVGKSLGRWKIASRFDVEYFRCPRCRFVQTEEPYWLESVYNDAASVADVGIVARNLLLADVTHAVITTWLDPAGRFLDFGGGHGLLVRLMRDRGFDFQWQDKYANAPVLCRGFEAEATSTGFDLVTAFEVAEHLPDPVSGFREMLSRGRTLLFSTELMPADDPLPGDWWYYVLEFGQHVSLYSRESLEHLARQLGLYLASNGSTIHLMSERRIDQKLFRSVTRGRVARAISRLRRRPSLIESDFARVLSNAGTVTR